VFRPGKVLAFLGGIARRNLGLKGIALVLAVALWWFVAGESKVQVGFVVPLEIRSIPPGLTITNKVERQVEIRLSGPPSLLGGLQQSDIIAAIDLSQAKAGKQVIPLTERSVRVPPGIKVQRLYPGTIEVSLERLEQRMIPVVARIGGPASVRRRISRIAVDPPALAVEALPEDFSRIRSLSTPELVPEVHQDIYAANVRVELREGHAKIVGNQNVRVTIHFR
jgi:YbbR domain-containing protein